MLEESLSAQNEYDIEHSLNNNEINLLNNKRTNVNVNLESINKLFFLYILSIPLACADILFANYDKKCVCQDITQMTINMYDYLIISGGYTFIMVIILVGILLCVDYEKIKNDKFLELVINYYNKMNLIFLLFINIAAAIMFWVYMNTAICIRQTYNYLFVSLIIKLVFCLFYSIDFCKIFRT